MVMMRMMKKWTKICLHQWLKKPKTVVRSPGSGDCSTCEPDENNKKCSCYCEITRPQEIEIREKK